MSKSFCLIDDSMTLHGMRFLPEGGDMDRFRENSILLYMHVRGVVLGKWNNIRLEAGRWLADPEFDMEDPEAAKIGGKVERGFLKACSLGVLPIEVQMINGEPWATKWQAIECSIVDAGSNANALMLYNPKGELIEDSLNAIQNLTIPIMSVEKKTVTGTEGAPVTAVVPAEIALAAGLAEDATPTSVAAKFKELTDKNIALELAAKTDKESQVKELLDKAVLEKRISAIERPHYETLAAVSFDSVKAIISKIPQPVDLVTLAAGGTTADPVDNEALAEEYKKLDKSGKLVALAASNPLKFKTLYKARYGKEFVAA